MNLRAEYLRILEEEYHVDPGTTNAPLPEFDPDASLLEVYEQAFEGLKAGKSMSISLSNSRWQSLLNDCMKRIASTDHVKQSNVFIGQIPRADFNARVFRYPGNNYLILMHGGLALYIFRIASIWAAIAKFGGDGIIHPPLIPLERGRELMSVALNNILNEAHPWPIQLNNNEAVKYVEFITGMIERFVICHELGHISMGHLEKPHQVEHEFEADAKGYEFYRLLVDEINPNFPGDHLKKVFYTSPHLMFMVFSVIENYLLQQGVPLARTHPPSEERFKRLKKIQDTTGGQISPEFFQQFSLLF